MQSFGVEVAGIYLKNIAVRTSRDANGNMLTIAHFAMRSVTYLLEWFRGWDAGVGVKAVGFEQWGYGATKLHLRRTVPATSSTPVICTTRERHLY